MTLAGQRYIYLSGTDRVIRAKFGKVGVHCMKTQQGEEKDKKLFHVFVAQPVLLFLFSTLLNIAVIVSTYEEPVQPQQAASIVEKLGDYLITCGY